MGGGMWLRGVVVMGSGGRARQFQATHCFVDSYLSRFTVPRKPIQCTPEADSLCSCVGTQ